MGYLTFTFAKKSDSGKTEIWRVIGSDRSTLGWVSWSGPWRKYIYAANTAANYDAACLREIADFCETKTKEHRNVSED
jgi:hypothetical protein